MHLFLAPLRLHTILSIEHDVSFYYNADAFDSLSLPELKCSLPIYKYFLATHAQRWLWKNSSFHASVASMSTFAEGN